MGELVCTVIALLFLFGSFSIFMSVIVDKHDEDPVKHGVLDKNVEDAMLVDEVFIDEDLLENE